MTLNMLVQDTLVDCQSAQREVNILQDILYTPSVKSHDPE